MSTYITEECINCGACVHECANNAIYSGVYFYEINKDLCTECVGFHGEAACQSVCPVECCFPDPNNPEIEFDLLEKAKKLHLNKKLPNFKDLNKSNSRFRK